jgi:hypothetical protein
VKILNVVLIQPGGIQIEKAFKEANCTKTTVVSLLPARVDTRWFHNHIYNKCGVEIEFIKGRLKFGDAKNSAPFPSMVVVFKPCPDPSIQYCRSGESTTAE